MSCRVRSLRPEAEDALKWRAQRLHTGLDPIKTSKEIPLSVLRLLKLELQGALGFGTEGELWSLQGTPDKQDKHLKVAIECYCIFLDLTSH